MRPLLRILSAYFCVLWLSSAVWAQALQADDLATWDTFALSVESTIDANTSNDDVFNALRKRVAEYRSSFDAARGVNAERIAVLRQQLTALSTTSEDETADAVPSDVGAKRSELEAQLATLSAPVQQAEAAFLRADALIGQIDQIMRDRQAERLMEVSPTPLNPAHWTPAIADVVQGFRALQEENSAEIGDESMKGFRQSAPIVFGLAFIGSLLILRGRAWSSGIVKQLHKHGARAFGVWRFVVSLLRIILPLAGIMALVAALYTTGLLGPKSTKILMVLAAVSAMMLGFRWVSERVFSRDDDEALILLSDVDRKSMRFHVVCITMVIVLGELLKSVLDAGSPSRASAPVVMFPILLFACFSLFRIGILLRRYSQTSEVGGEQRTSNLSRIVRWFGTGAIVVAILSPLLMAAGYFKAIEAILPPYLATLMLFGLVLTLQRFTADVYGAITGQGVQAREALLPILFGMTLVILAMPVLALIWGARVTDLTELWSAIGRGFAIGDSRISPRDFLSFVVIFAIGYALTRLLQGALRTNVLPKTKIDVGGQNAVVSGLGYIGIFLAALAAITGAGIDLSSLAIVAGALSVGIGFGLQNIVSNFVSGIILLIERPISQGDWIEVGGQMGYVRDISVRSTRIETFDRTDVIVPNADLVSGTVTNYTRGNTVGRIIVTVGVAYGTDTRRVAAILLEIAEAQPMVLASPAPNVVFVNFGADALEFEVRMMLRDVNWTMNIKSDVNHAIAERFAAENIEIPFAQRDLWIRNPEALTGAGPHKMSEPPEVTKPEKDQGTT
jgi:small-conductance mechanosensitive channel